MMALEILMTNLIYDEDCDMALDIYRFIWTIWHCISIVSGKGYVYSALESAYMDNNR